MKRALVLGAGGFIGSHIVRRLKKEGFCDGNINPFEQDHNEASYCSQRQDSDGLIDWTSNAVDIDAFIRAQDAPYPRAFFKLDLRAVRRGGTGHCESVWGCMRLDGYLNRGTVHGN